MVIDYNKRINIENSNDLFKLPIYTYKKKKYVDCGFSLDIETTNLVDDSNKKDIKRHAYMVIWQVTFLNNLYYGRKWEDLKRLIENINHHLRIRHLYTLCFIHNTSFEFAFIMHHFPITNVFADEPRKPLRFNIASNITVLDSMRLTNYSLENLAKNYTNRKKLIGSWNYDLIRNDKTPLSSDELAYAFEDVYILEEYSHYYFNTFMPRAFMPLTQTGVLRQEVKESYKATIQKYFGKRSGFKLSDYMPTEQLYDIWMRWLFRGGYVHANLEVVGDVCHEADHVDYTSFYPYTMTESDQFPISKFEVAEASKWEEYALTYATIGLYEFEYLEPVFNHSIDSKSKIITAENPVWDNGRLLYGKNVLVMLTEKDLEIYRKFYKPTKISCKHLMIAKRGFLPRYIVDVLLKYYKLKDDLKKAGLSGTPEYANAKACANSCYGMLVTKRHPTIHKFELGGWYEEPAKPYEKDIKNTFLLPQWGIYVTSICRNKILNQIYELESNEVKCYYTDTDSIFFQASDKATELINKYNERNYNHLKEVCERRQIDFNIVKGSNPSNALGGFTFEKRCKNYKTLGAKRYLCEYEDGTIEQTIAGLKKTVLQERYNQGEDVFELFDNLMYIDKEESQKLMTDYNDDPHEEEVIDYLGNRSVMRELSSVCLYKVPFKLSLDKEYHSMVLNGILDILKRKGYNYDI